MTSLKPAADFHPGKCLPDCMIPDGGECCPGYVALYDAYWRLLKAAPWQLIETAPKDEMFIWAYKLDGKWRLGLAYQNVSGGWSDAYASDAPRHATHWMPLPAPPEASQ